MGAAIPLIAAGVSGLAGLIGGNQTNQANAKQQAEQDAFNAQQAQLNRDYQTQMSNTAWQRGVADMKAAGLNPALAYQQGGASSPSGSTASSAGMIPRQNVLGSGVNSAVQAASAAADVKQKMANTDLTTAQAGQIRTMLAAQLAKVQADTDLSSAGASLNRQREAESSAGTARTLALYPGEAKNLEANWLRTMASAEQTRAQTSLIPMQGELMRLSIPAARNLSNAANTLWGRYVTPYLGDAKSISQTLNPWIP